MRAVHLLLVEDPPDHAGPDPACYPFSSSAFSVSVLPAKSRLRCRGQPDRHQDALVKKGLPLLLGLPLIGSPLELIWAGCTAA